MSKDKKRLGRESTSPLSAFGNIKKLGVFLFVLSGVVNILALTGAIYMLQIYDRALTSQSIPTLLALSLLAICLYLFQGTLDITRSQILVRLGAKFDRMFAPLAHKVAIDMPRFGYSTAEARERSRDVDTIRQFMSSQAPQALFDLPWMPLYIAFIYVLHPWLGALTIAGASILAILTIITEIVTRNRAKDANVSEVIRSNTADSHTRNADVIRALGFTSRAVQRFEDTNNRHLQLQTKMNDLAGTLGGLSKVLRMILQSAVLGLGAFLTIRGDITAGAIIAASVASARALAPIDIAIGQWKVFVGARRSFARLKETLESIVQDETQIDLPAPEKSLKIEGVTVAAPGTGSVVLSDVSLKLEAGEALGLIGPTGSGKSSFAKGITGIWPLVRGHVRLDEADIRQWRSDDLGKHLGYLPQEVALLDGTIAENIARFDPEATSEKILEAAKAAGVHELIVRLPDGYETQLGPNGTALSGGQRQRIGLARALYDNPFLVVLDEPNSNLDFEGEQALFEAISKIKERNAIVIVIAHRPSAIAACDKVGVMKNGQLATLGPKEEVFQSLGLVSETHTKKPQMPFSAVSMS